MERDFRHSIFCVQTKIPKSKLLAAKGGILKNKTAKKARTNQLEKVMWTEDTVYIIEPRQNTEAIKVLETVFADLTEEDLNWVDEFWAVKTSQPTDRLRCTLCGRLARDCGSDL